jgi:hypothetical protein
MMNDNPTVWIKYECEQGCRWTAMKGSFLDLITDDECNFSGCEPGHRVTVVGETTDSNEAHDWFRDAHRDEEGGHA